MDGFYRTHRYLVEQCNAPVRRGLMDEIDWSARMIGIKGTRGVGKTTFLLQYIKERFQPNDRRCLYINMNNFYFQGRGIADFAGEFYRQGGRVLLIDQVYKQQEWSKELRTCYDMYSKLKIIFSGSSVMRLKQENPELCDIAKSYNLRGFSFREYLNLKTGLRFRSMSLDEILSDKERLVGEITAQVNPLEYFEDYIKHGFYPLFREHDDFSENLLKSMNMMTEVDILMIKQIELKYLTKIKKLFYLLATNELHSLNISLLAKEIQTSRATVMNYIKYLADARLINIIYPVGQDYPKKPTKVMLHNPNLYQVFTELEITKQRLMETFMVNTLWKDHKVNQSGKEIHYTIDGSHRFKVCRSSELTKLNAKNKGTLYCQYDSNKVSDNMIPLWLLGFLY
ncbi:MAG: AAA family ATPase [Prevotella sp.]|nr:AAA family ATPase [Prevotella sp.]